MEKIIYCQRSGLPLLVAKPVCTLGYPLLSMPEFSTMVHPIYGWKFGKILNSYGRLLEDADEADWKITDEEIQNISLRMSALMYSMDCMWVPPAITIEGGWNIEPSLPSRQVTLQGAPRLYTIALRYFHFARKLDFPTFRVSKAAGNLNWHGLLGWLDEVEDIISDAEKQIKREENKELLRARASALKSVRAVDIYKKLNLQKVWNWMDMQLAEDRVKFPLPRRQELKDFFLNGHASPEYWSLVDCDDLSMGLVELCDNGNEISHFIHARIKILRDGIRAFYSTFNVLGPALEAEGDNDPFAPSAEELQKKKELEEKLSTITEPPKPGDYPSRIAFMKAQALYNLAMASKGK